MDHERQFQAEVNFHNEIVSMVHSADKCLEDTTNHDL